MNAPVITDSLNLATTEAAILNLFEEMNQDYYNFVPRPDDPANFDEQESFINESINGCAIHQGGNGSGTTTAAVRKAVLFMLHKQPPPRKDTPFWIITPSYELGINALWKEKMLGRGHMPKAEIDFERISWFEKKSELPIRVPLKPWPRERGGHPDRNWCIEFKSWMSGREAMQMVSIGGFLVSEQIPWDCLQEIYTRCRDYHYPGSMSYEFTPVDPAMTSELEAIIAQDKLPPGWDVYRSSTVRNAQMGYVSQQWLEGFKGAVSDEMLETRLTGAFPAFEGVIYPNFLPRVHGRSTREIDKILTYEREFWGEPIHRRSIDWGTSKEHPFVTLFGCRLNSGRWVIYDEIFSEDQMISDEMVALVLNRREWPKRNPAYGTTYADPARPDLMRAAGREFSVQAANNSVYEGIESVRVAMKIAADNLPNLIIDYERCPNLIRQLRGYRWLRSPQTGINPRVAKPEPLKRDDDAPDALRYMIHSESSVDGPSFGQMNVHREVPSHLLALHKWAYGNGKA